MKQLFALLLTAVLCLGLVSCKSGNTETPNGDDILDMDDSGSVSEKESTGSWLERLPGEYAALPSLQNFVLNSDKTCNIEGGSYTWDTRESDEDGQFVVDVFDGNTKVYEVRPRLHEDDYIQAVLATVDEEGNTNTLPAPFFNLDDIYVIELTPDNWQDYLEYVERCEFFYDASGEVSSMTIDIYYQLKEEYSNVIPDISRDAALQYNRRIVERMITVDTENETYEWGDITEIREDSYPDSIRFGSVVISDDFSCFCFYVSEVGVTNFPEEETHYDEIEPFKFLGTIYAVPKR